MSGINKVILIGHLGKEPEIKTFENGIKKASFTLATSEVYKDKEGNRKEQTEWHNIFCWRNLAEIADKYLTKGKLIYLEGKLRNRSWEDNGVKKYITEVEATTFTMLSSKSENSAVTHIPNRGDSFSSQMEEPDEPIEQEDDLPF